MLMTKSCGIDFGTSNSAIAVSENNVRLIKVEGDSVTIPTALFFKSKEVLFGRAAQKSYMLGEEGRFMRSLKRVLGTSLMSQGTVVNGRSVYFQDIISKFVANLKQKAEAAEGEIANVVMGRPVHFVDGDKDADTRAQNELEQIAKSCGFKNIEFQYEPIAAAFAHEQSLTQESLSLVVDIGGGTSDFSIIRLSPDRKEDLDRKGDILANTGVRIGGNDFDKDLSIKTVMPNLGYETTYGEKNLIVPRAQFHDISEWSKVNFVYTARILRDFNLMLEESYSPKELNRFVEVLKHQYGHHLLDTIENAKIDLTSNSKSLFDLSYIEENLALNITREELSNSIKENVSKVMKNAKECLSEAGLKPQDMDLIILTGGSTEIPYIQSVLSKNFPNAKLSQENKLSSVTLGLAYDAKRRF